MQNKRNLFAIGEAANYLGVSVDTLRRWEKKGKVKTFRSPGGHRYFEKEELDNLFGRKYERGELSEESLKSKPLSKTTKIETGEVAMTKEVTRPKLVVPRYFKSQRISKYDLLLSNASRVQAESGSLLQLPTTPIEKSTIPNSILEPPSTHQAITKPPFLMANKRFGISSSCRQRISNARSCFDSQGYRNA